MSKPHRPRLIDLHIDWMAQYRGETPNSGPPCPPDRLARLDGYLSTTRAAFLFDDSPTTTWESVDSWITRVLAEFSGRILANPDDHRHWTADEPEPICWAVLTLGAAFSGDSTQEVHRERMKSLADRGVRVFPATDDLALLSALLEIATTNGRTFALDLANRPRETQIHLLDWLGGETGRPARLVPILSRCEVPNPDSLDLDVWSRIADLGGLIGLTFDEESPADPAWFARLSENLQSACGVATGFLGDRILAEPMSRADRLIGTISSKLEPSLAHALLEGNAARLITRLTGSDQQSA